MQDRSSCCQISKKYLSKYSSTKEKEDFYKYYLCSGSDLYLCTGQFEFRLKMALMSIPHTLD
nr:MAG: hypothetical protein [Microvirus Sku12]